MNNEKQELQMWRDFDKWLKEVAFGEEQYKVLMAEFYKDYNPDIGENATLCESCEFRRTCNEGKQLDTCDTYSTGHNENETMHRV